MKELQYLIQDVREQTDNVDTNGVKDREIVRYFNDGVKTIQAIIFKNNPLCSYFQEPEIYNAVAGSREYTLPTDCYADNAVSLVEIEGERTGVWIPLERVWPEDGLSFFGWFTRNKTVVISGSVDSPNITKRIRVWYFKRLPRFDKAWAVADGPGVGTGIDLIVSDSQFPLVDNYITFLNSVTGLTRLANVKILSVVGGVALITNSTLTTVLSSDLMLMGKDSSLTLDLPDEVEPYLMDYVAQRIAGRNNYTEEWNKLNYWTSEERGQIISIFADASQAQVRAPLTDLDYMEI